MPRLYDADGFATLRYANLDPPPPAHAAGAAAAPAAAPVGSGARVPLGSATACPLAGAGGGADVGVGAGGAAAAPLAAALPPRTAELSALGPALAPAPGAGLAVGSVELELGGAGGAQPPGARAPSHEPRALLAALPAAGAPTAPSGGDGCRSSREEAVAVAEAEAKAMAMAAELGWDRGAAGARGGSSAAAGAAHGHCRAASADLSRAAGGAPDGFAHAGCCAPLPAADAQAAASAPHRPQRHAQQPRAAIAGNGCGSGDACAGAVPSPLQHAQAAHSAQRTACDPPSTHATGCASASRAATSARGSGCNGHQHGRHRRTLSDTSQLRLGGGRSGGATRLQEMSDE